ncbi:MAG: response regulator, partial [Acidobacteriota bacterium]|nr:response regulator [Acidobacteriota bacterium]
YSVVPSDGEERIIAWHTAALTDDAGQHIGTLCSGSDITDMRRLAAEKATAESATRAKSQFLANVSHEIRTPLNGVLGMIELLSNSSLSELQRRFADTAAVSAKNLMAILNDVLDFSKIEAGKLPLETVAFDLRQVVEEVGALFAEAAHQKGLELLHEVPGDIPTTLLGDPNRLRQILSNLVGNAVKFTSEGEVALSLEVVSETPDKINLCFEVRDSGIGIDGRVSGSVFESFHQADQSTTRKFGGTGLGLAISKQLVELLGGEIGVKSETGSGSLFWFTMPLLRAFPGVGVNEPEVRKFESPAPRVLVVDDNKSSRAQVRGLLEAWGAEVTCLPEGSAALLDLLEASRSAKPFDALLVDHYMPDMDGLELARAVKAQANLSSLPVVLMANTSIPPEDEMERAGISSYLVKPVRHGELFLSLARALRFDCAPELRAREPESAELLPFHALVAEDNAVNQEVIGGMLAALGGTADFVGNGREAVNAFVDGRYDVVFMDCQMPVMDGYGASQAIREHEERTRGSHLDGKKRVPIVALTANALGDDRRKCVAAGMDNYLSKPCGLEDLRRALSVYLPLRAASATSPAPLKAVPAPSSGGINPAVFDKIRELGGNAPSGFVEKVVTTYLETSPELVERMGSALASGDGERLADAAHTLKSSSASLGAERLAALCRKIERLGREGRPEKATDLVEAAEGEFALISVTLTDDYQAKSA